MGNLKPFESEKKWRTKDTVQTDNMVQQFECLEKEINHWCKEQHTKNRRKKTSTNPQCRFDVVIAINESVLFTLKLPFPVMNKWHYYYYYY